MYRINNDEALSNVEAMDLVMIPKMSDSNQHLVLEKADLIDSEFIGINF